MLLVLALTSFYPSVRENSAEFDRLLNEYPAAFRAFFDVAEFTSPAGYLEAELYGFMVPLLFTVFAIVRGSRAVAGEEEDGTLELLLAHPVRRRRVVIEQAAALALGLVGLTAITIVATILGSAAFDLTVPAGNVVAATALAALLALDFGLLALAVGSFTGHRALAGGVAAAVAVAAYVVDSLGRLADWMEPVSQWSPWRAYSGPSPLREGFPLPASAALAVGAFALAALAAWALERRDLAA